MTEGRAIQKMKDGIDVIRQKHPNGGAFDYIKATGGISLISKIYHDFNTRICKNCTSYNQETKMCYVGIDIRISPDSDYAGTNDEFGCNKFKEK